MTKPPTRSPTSPARDTRCYPAGIIGIPGWLRSEQVAGFDRNRWLESSECAVAGQLALLTAFVAGICWLLLFVVARVARGATPLVVTWQAALWQQAQAGRSDPARGLIALLDPAHPGSRSAFFLMVLLAVGMCIGVALLLEPAAAGQDGQDGAVQTMFRGLRSLWSDVVLGDVSLVLAVSGVVSAAVGLAWAVMQRASRVAALWLGCIALAWVIARLTGPAIQTLGVVEFLGVLGQHSGALALVLGVFSTLCARSLSRRADTLLALSTTLAIALSASASLYFGARPSELATGLALALFGVGIIGFAYHAGSGTLARGGLAASTAAALVIVLGGGMAVFGPDYAGPVRPTPPPRLFQAQAWWDGEWTRLPERRIDLEDTPGEPLTLQWAGSAEDVVARLAPSGWIAPPSWTFRSALTWLEDAPDGAGLPVVPRLHRGLPPTLTLVRPDDGCPDRACVLVLRLWTSRAMLTGTNSLLRPVLVGTAVRQVLRRPLPLVTVSVAQPDVNGPRDAVGQALGLGRIALRPDAPPTPDWDGRVLIAPQPTGAISQGTGAL